MCSLACVLPLFAESDAAAAAAAAAKQRGNLVAIVCGCPSFPVRSIGCVVRAAVDCPLFVHKSEHVKKNYSTTSPPAPFSIDECTHDGCVSR